MHKMGAKAEGRGARTVGRGQEQSGPEHCQTSRETPNITYESDQSLGQAHAPTPSGHLFAPAPRKPASFPANTHMLNWRE